MTHTAAVWSDRDLFQARHEKSAAAFVAVQCMLRGGKVASTAGAEFLRLYRLCLELPAPTFTRLWCDPTAYFWARTAYDLVGRVQQGGALGRFAEAYLRALAGDDPEAWLDAHLQQFARFGLAAAALTGRELRLHTPWRARLPVSLPGTPYHLTGAGEVRLLGHAESGLLVSDGTVCHRLLLRDGESAAGVRVVSEPTLPLGTARLRLSAAPFAIPGAAFAAAVADCDAAYHRRHRPVLHAAFELVKRYHPQTYAQMVDTLQLIALKPYDRGGFTNLSHSDLPGAFIISVVNNGFELADTLIHEFYHNRLFFLEEQGAFFTDAAQNAAEDGAYYSPWRDDLRPLDGILHAAYVHLPVTEYWLNLFKGEELDETNRLYAMDRLVRYPIQIAVGLQQLRRFGRFSPAGEALMAELEARLADLRRRIACVLPRGDVPAYVCAGGGGAIVRDTRRGSGEPMSVYQSLWWHCRRFDTAGQCRELLSNQFSAA